MFLKSLQMQGFKSFPDKTTIQFNKGITAIVGPNGSGKSNINDAVRWVLGEMSTKTLRGTKMEDVIFDGTSSRKPMGFAEVSLTLDNSDKSLPIDFAEVTVTRRYYRSGESEYQINRNPVRLKDIHELLMDTGLGRDGYSIIGQGKISDILASKSDERRQIFEEAAGISKYRYRKQETQRRLEQTEENLVRLRDILTELEDRVGPLEKQAETAKEYLKLRDEKKELEVSLWLGAIDGIRENKEKIEQAYTIARRDLENAEQEISAKEKAAEEVFLSSQQATLAIDALRADATALGEQAAAKEGEIALLQSDCEHNNELIRRISEELSADNEKMKSFDDLLLEKHGLSQEYQEKLSELQQQLDELIGNSAAILQQETECEDRVRVLNEAVVSLSAQIADAKLQIGVKENSFSLLSQNFSALSEELTRAREERQRLAVEVQEREQEVAQTEATIQSLTNSLSGYDLRISSASARLQKQLEEKQAIENQINAKEVRLNTLSSMQSHFDGYAESVKNIMRASSQRRLSGICGPVSSLIRTKDEFALAIETALGAAMQNIVVQNEADAKAALYYLKDNKAGRATFLPISTMRPNPIPARDLQGAEGLLGVASEVVDCDARYRDVVDWLLGRICVVRDLDSAVRLAKKIGYKYRVVTQDGQVVNSGGSMTGGSAVKGAGLLSRQNEMERLARELAAHRAEREKKEAECRETQEKLSHDSALADAVRAEIQTNREARTAAALRLDDVVARRQNAEVAENQLSEKDRAMHAEAEAAGREAEQLKKLLNELNEKLSKATDEMNQQVSGREDILARREKITEQIQEKKLAGFTIQKEIESLDREQAELLRYKEERAGVMEAKTAEQQILHEKNDRIAQAIQTGRAEAEELRRQAEEKKSLTEKMRQEREKHEKQVTELRACVRDLSAGKEKLIREVERFETRRESIESEYDSIVAKLFDEYELTLTDAQAIRKELEHPSRAQQRLGEIKNRIKRMGDVNVGAIEEYRAVKERYDFYTAQITDLEKARTDMEKIIAELTEQMKTIFGEQFGIINQTFQQTFRELFGGGKAHLSLTDPQDLLGSGIDIQVTPPGKVIKNLSSLSGGEQAFVAIALYFAIIRVRPTPFCIMDEIETALDEVNTARFADFLHTITEHTQVIVVSHRRSTMEAADVLYGVTMQEKGVSKLLTINVGEVYEELLP